MMIENDKDNNKSSVGNKMEKWKINDNNYKPAFRTDQRPENLKGKTAHTDP